MHIIIVLSEHQKPPRELDVSSYPEGFEPISIKDKHKSDGSNNGKEEHQLKVEGNRSEGYKLVPNYYVGLDWIDKKQTQPVLVVPKLDDGSGEVDVLAMLDNILNSKEAAKHLGKAYQIKTEVPLIPIAQEHDKLSMLMVIHFLNVMKQLTRRGLRRKRYTVEENLHGRVKGKVMVGPNIRKNSINLRPDRVYCRYAVHGLDSAENRVLKKTLRFVQRYIGSYPSEPKNFLNLQQTLNQCLAPFASVGEDVSLHEMQHPKPNPFYREYGEALRLARLILRRFGFQLTNVNVNSKEKVLCPPYWINMPMLFELFAMEKLEKRPGIKLIGFQKHGKYGYTDILLKEDGKPVVVDAKYKKLYQNNQFNIEDIRQVCGYTRDGEIREKLSYGENDDMKILPGCIVYPIRSNPNPEDDGDSQSILTGKINGFTQLYKYAIVIPTKHSAQSN